ncbi:MAG: hydrolase [Clostridia bacterium]|nr:hydrolase [Clostridia bacterium]
MEEKIDVKSAKEKYLKIFKENIKREGAQELLEFIEKSDFFTSPASSKFHSNFEGGLCLHCVNVYERFKNILTSEYGEELSHKISNESIAVIALLHDLCKIENYKVDYRNVKVNGEWTKQAYYAYNDSSLPYGHGEKSVYMISGYMRLTREEAMAINWHMGGFDSRVLGGSYDLSRAFRQFPTTLLFSIADLSASYLDEIVIG